MNSHQQIIFSLFETIEMRNFDEKALDKIKLIIKSIPEFEQINKREIAYYKRFQNDHPSLNIEIPEEFTINAKNFRGGTPLIEASKAGLLEVVKILIAAKADLDAQNAAGTTALIEAIWKGRLDIVTELIESKANPDIRDSSRDTALTWAAYYGYREIVNVLIKAKANLNIQGQFNDTALASAIFKNHIDIAYDLLNTNTDITIKGMDENTVLMEAVRHNIPDFIEALLLRADVGLEAVNRKGRTALDCAINHKHVSNIALLLEHGAKINTSRISSEELIDVDQREPDFLKVITYIERALTSEMRLLTSLSQIEKSHINDTKLSKTTQVYDDLVTYSKKFKKLYDIYAEKITKHIDEATQKKMPTVLVKLITQYDAPLMHSSIPFFAPEKIDSLLEQAQPKERSHQQNKLCSMM